VVVPFFGQRLNIILMIELLIFGAIFVIVAVGICVMTNCPTWVGVLVACIIFAIVILIGIVQSKNGSSNNSNYQEDQKDERERVNKEYWDSARKRKGLKPIESSSSQNEETPKLTPAPVKVPPKPEDNSFNPLVTEVTLRSYVSPAVFGRAWRELYRPKHVGEIHKSGNVYSAYVESAEGYLSYSVSATIENGEIVAHSCTCPAHAKYSGPCKHVIALVLQVNVTSFPKEEPKPARKTTVTPYNVLAQKPVNNYTIPYCPPETDETPEKNALLVSENTVEEEVVAIPPEPKPSLDLKVGDFVSHPKFGKGKITSVEDGLIKVSFSSLGVKLFENPGAFDKGYLTKI
jgi:hypothetical protein